MDKLRKKIKQKPHLALSIPALLCLIAFVTNFVASLRDGVIDSTELHKLLSMAEGSQGIILVIIMLALGNKKK